MMDKESGSPAKAKRVRKGPGRPPKVKHSGDFLTSLPRENVNSMLEEVKQSSEDVCDKDSLPLQPETKPQEQCECVSDDKFLMPPPPPTVQSESSVENEGDDDTPGSSTEKGDEEVIDGFSIICYGTEEAVADGLKKHGKPYLNKRLNIDKHVTVKSPRLPTRESRSPTGRKGKAPARSKKESRGTSASRRSKGVSEISPLAKEQKNDWESMETVTEASNTNKIEDQKDVPKMTDDDIKLKPQADGSLENNALKQEGANSQVADSCLEFKSENKNSTIIEKVEAKTEPAIQPISPPTFSSDKQQQACLAAATLLSSSDPTALIKPSSSPSSSGSPYPRSSNFIKGSNGDRAYIQAANSSTVSSAALTPRSNSVPSAGSSNSRQTTPVCTNSNSFSRERDGSNSRTTSRNSERNPSQSSQQHSVPSGDPYTALFGANSYNQLINPNMLTFGGPNGIAAPFNHAQPTGLPSASGFPFGTDLLQPFNHHHANMAAAASQEVMRAELSRRLLLDASNERVMAPFLRPELMYPTGAGLNPNVPPNMPGSLLQMRSNMFANSQYHQPQNNVKFDKMPLLYHPRSAAAAAAAAAAASASNIPAANISTPVPPGPSPFQSVPGGVQSSVSSPDSTQKKSGKWCAAHVRIAWNIFKMQGKPHSELKNGTSSSTSLSSEKHPIAPNISHSINAITANIHRPKDVSTASITRLQSPSVTAAQFDRRSLPSSPHTDNHKTATASSSSYNSPPVVPSLMNKDKFCPSGINGSMLSHSASKDARWSKAAINSSMSSSSALCSKRDRDERDIRRSSKTANGSPNTNSSNRPSSSDRFLSHHNRSRSRSPINSSNQSSHKNLHDSLTLSNDFKDLKTLEALRLRPDIYHQQLLATSSSNNSSTDLRPQHTALLNSMYSNLDPKSMGTNGLLGPIASTTPSNLWSSFNMEQSNRERLMAMQQQYDLQSYRTSAASLNGFHQNNTLSSLSSIVGPPPLIPTTQTKLGLHTNIHPIQSSSHTSTTSNGLSVSETDPPYTR